MNLENFKNTISTQVKQGQIPKSDFVHSFFEFKDCRNWWQSVNFDFLAELPQNSEELILEESGNANLKTSTGRESLKTPLKELNFQLALELLAIRNAQNWNYKNPFVSFYTSISNRPVRVSLIHHSCTTNGTSKGYIRFQGNDIRKLEEFTDQPSVVSSLEHLILERKNILICGATGSGKTSFLSSLLQSCHRTDHLIIVEDTPEIQYPTGHATKLLAQAQEKKSIKDYLTYAMRMGPDRIIIGELRSEEVIGFLMALNTGHHGCLSTIHANNGLEAIDRLCLLFNLFNEKSLSNEYVKKLACNAIEYIVLLENKKVQEIIRIINFHEGKVIYEKLEKVSVVKS